MPIDASKIRTDILSLDDGRRYLRRTQQKFDAIVVDPPPPFHAAGSSLLFSREFCALRAGPPQAAGNRPDLFPGWQGCEHKPCKTGASQRSGSLGNTQKTVGGPGNRKINERNISARPAFSSPLNAPAYICSPSMVPIEIPDREQLATRLPRAPGAI